MNFYNRNIKFIDDSGELYPEWEEKHLKELIAVGKAGGTPTASNKSYYNGEAATISFLGISDMTEQGKYLSTTSKNITKEGLDSSSAWLVPAGYLVYAMYASVGKVGIAKKPMATSQAMFSMTFIKSADTEYIYYYLEHFRDNGLKLLITTGTQGNINADTLKSFNIPLPSLAEQQKIAEFFSALDERIALTADKVKLLKEQKTGYLQQVFAQEIVFTDDNGDRYADWDQKKLSEVAAVTSGKRLPKGHQFVPSGTPYITVSDMGGKKVDQKRFSFISPATETILQRYKVTEGDVIISIAGTLGKVNLIDASLEQANLTENCDKIRVNEGIIPEFIYYFLKSPSIQSDIEKTSTTSSQPKLALEQLRNFSISLPSLSEQGKIAEFFSALDEQLELTENKLTLLKEQKTGYLQGIFG